MSTSPHINSIWNVATPKRRFWNFFLFWKSQHKNSVKIATPKHITDNCKGLNLKGNPVKTILYSTDLALIENNDADAVLAVYPFPPSISIIKTLIAFSDRPVICGIGGGLTQGDYAIEIALQAQEYGAAAVIVNQPFKNEDIVKLKNQLSIPIIASVSTINFDFKARIEAGVSCFNVTGGTNTVAIVEHIQHLYPGFPILSTGGKTVEALHTIVKKKINAVVLTPPSNAALFRSIMDDYRAL